MTDQPTGSAFQPQLLPPAVPEAFQTPAVRPRGGGFLRGVLVLFAILGFVAAVMVGGILAVASIFSFSQEDWIEEAHYGGDRSSPHKIAIVSAEDIIMESTAEHVIRQLKKAAKDDRVKAVVLKVDSPGGTITASDHIHREVHKLKASQDNPKPVVVSMQSLAASGGYYISVAADEIFAERTTMMGSIGVIASFPNVSGLMEKWHIQMEVIKTGPEKDAGSPFRPMLEQERQRWQEIIGDAFERFIEVVSEGRKMEQSMVKKLATGGIFTAREALDKGLIDKIGYLDDAIAAAESRAGVTDSHVIEYKRPLELSELLFGQSSASKQAIPIDFESLLRANVPRVMYLTQGPTIGL